MAEDFCARWYKGDDVKNDDDNQLRRENANEQEYFASSLQKKGSAVLF